MAKSDFDKLMSIGVDIGKDTFHLVGLDQAGQRVLRKCSNRSRSEVGLQLPCGAAVPGAQQWRSHG